MQVLSVFLVDDHARFRNMLASFLNSEPSLRVVGQAESGADAMDQVSLLHPDLVLMDVQILGMGI